MAIVRAIPNDLSLLDAIKVAIPSGILCNIIANIDIITTLYKVPLSLIFSSGKYLSIKKEIIIPILINNSNII